MAEVAKKIELVFHPGGSATLIVDEVEFPWSVVSDGLQLGGKVNEFPTLTVSILAEQVVTRFAEPEAPAEEVEQSEVRGPEKWKLGTRFILGRVDEPPLHVRGLQCVGDESDRPFLIRNPEDPGDWGWSHYPDSASDEGSFYSWKHWASAEHHSIWTEQEFEVVFVQG